MLIYNKKDDKVEIYEMVGDSEKIKRYKKGVISRHKNDGLSYSLKTMFDKANESSEILLVYLDFYTTLGSYFGTEYSKLQLLELESETVDKYLSGLYDDLVPINIVEYFENRKEFVHRFLKTGGLEEKNINFHRVGNLII